MPGTLRKASWTKVRFCSANSFLSTVSVDCEISCLVWMAVPVTSMLGSLSSSSGAALSAYAWTETKAVTAAPAAAKLPVGIAGSFAAAGAAVTALVSVHAYADSAAPLDEDKLPSIEVTGTAIHTRQDISQSTDTVDKKELAEQNLTLVQDALRNVPGITLNAGEGGSHGDSVNLRGLSIPDSFFLDGVRDIGQYQRDTFNTESIAVLLGPASAVFGRGSTSGVINSVSKQPMLEPLAAFSVSGGQIDYWRGTGDVNVPLSETAAVRLTVMDQSNGVVERDQVK